VPRTRQRYLEQAETVQGQAALLRAALGRVIQAESNGISSQVEAEEEYPRAMGGGGS
jgi:hypothetical protein